MELISNAVVSWAIHQEVPLALYIAFIADYTHSSFYRNWCTSIFVFSSLDSQAMYPQTQFCHTYCMCWVSDSSEMVFQLVVVFDFFMCKFLSEAFGSVATSLQPISNVVLFYCFFMEQRAFLMVCWLDVLLVECIRMVSSLFNTSKNWL